MYNYKISFFKIERELDKESGDMKKTGKESFLGSVVVDDCGVDASLTIQAKAFRRAPEACLSADKVLTERL